MGPALRWAGIACFLLVAAFFVAYRWEMRVEPFNSDDMTLYKNSVLAAEGRHWIYRDAPTPGNHHSLRLGMLVISAPMIRWLGPHATVYYLVPLLWAFVGFVVVWLTMRREISALLAAPFALFHVALPFELRDSSVFLADLPTAVLSLATVVLIGGSDRYSGRKQRVLAGVAAGLTLFWAYMMRTNAPVLLAPALCFLLFRKRTRIATLAAAGPFALGVLAEQLFYLSKGIPWGYRWQIVGEALDRYSRHLPVYEVEDFLTRQFLTVWRYFDGGVIGAIAVTFYCLALVGLVALLFQRRRPTLQALAAAGLTTWLVFGFAIYEVLDEGVRAMAPPNFRYFQLFYYTSVIAVCWLAARWLDMSRRWIAHGSPVLGRVGISALAMAIVGLISFAFWASAESIDKRIDDPCGEIRTLLCALDQMVAEAELGSAPEVTIDRASVRTLELFRDETTDPPVRWRVVTVAELVERAQQARSGAILVDRVRLYSIKKYLGEEFERRLADFETALDERYHPWIENRRHALYRLGDAAGGRTGPPNGDFAVLEPERQEIPGWTFTHEIPWKRSEEGAVSVSTMPDDDRALYLYSGDNPGFSTLPERPELYPLEGGETYSVRAELRLPEDIVASVFLIEFDDKERIGATSLPLRDGVNRVTITTGPEARYYRLALRFGERGEEPAEAGPEIRWVALSERPAVSSCACEAAEPGAR